MSLERLIEGLYDREGRVYAEPPQIDQPTAPGGITLGTLSEFLERPATLEELRALTLEQTRPIVRWVLDRDAERFGLDRIDDEELRSQMLDFAFNSGPALATRWLQRVLRVPRTGRMDPATVAAVNAGDPWLLHHALIAARLLMIDLSTDGGSIRKAFEEGLENRALSFSRLQVP